MQKILKLEEFAMLLFGAFLFSQLDYSWWWFFGLFFAPDLSMLGYAINPKIGAYTYNFWHHKGLAILLYAIGIFTVTPWLTLAGIIIFSHSSMDRMFGFGLKYKEGFKSTHLGEL